MAKRYTEKDKAKIVAFVRKQGRGGLTKATAKFGVTFPTLSRWMKEDGSAAPKKRGRKPAVVSLTKVKANGAKVQKLVKDIKGLEKDIANALKKIDAKLAKIKTLA